MKKIFIVLSVLAALIFSVAPSQALLGVPDDVPGYDVLLPFFLASMPGHGNTNTLLVISDVHCGLDTGPGGAPTDNFHYTVYTKRSETVYDDVLPGTTCDIIPTDALSIINLMAPSQRTKLEIDLDGDGVNDHYAGYIYFENWSTPLNNSVGAQILLVDLAKGMASSANAPVKETVTNGVCPQFTALYSGALVEQFSADALSAATGNQRGLGCLNAQAFGLYPRYFVNSANSGKTYLFIWKDRNWGTAAIPYTELHVLFFNAEEDAVSSNIPLPDELNIIDIEQHIPASLHSGVYPKEGFIQIETPDISGNGFFGDMEWVGYTWIKDVGAASESWTVLNPMWRDSGPPWDSANSTNRVNTK